MTDDDEIAEALERYREGEIGLREAAEAAGSTIGEMMEEAQQRGVLSNLDADELAEDRDALR